MTIPALPPFPVVLDLSDQTAHNTLTGALTDYANHSRPNVQDEEENERPDERLAADLRALADAADQLLTDIDRQLDESEKANS